MIIELDHTIVPARDKLASAHFFARVFGIDYDGDASYFASIHVNERLTLLFKDSEAVESHHYAFKVGETEFDAIFERVKHENIPYGSGPRSLDDMQINHRGGGRGVYFRDPNGHVLELLTV